jgi:hypothetical protein
VHHPYITTSRSTTFRPCYTKYPARISGKHETVPRHRQDDR